jgi:hypothetical protein
MLPLSAPVGAAQPGGSINRTITAPVFEAGNRIGRFFGNLTITDFIVENGEIVAVGTLAGTVRNGNQVISTISEVVQVPVESLQVEPN